MNAIGKGLLIWCAYPIYVAIALWLVLYRQQDRLELHVHSYLGQLMPLNTTHFPLDSSVVPGRKLYHWYQDDVQGTSCKIALNITQDLLMRHLTLQSDSPPMFLEQFSLYTK